MIYCALTIQLWIWNLLHFCSRFHPKLQHLHLCDLSSNPWQWCFRCIFCYANVSVNWITLLLQENSKAESWTAASTILHVSWELNCCFNHHTCELTVTFQEFFGPYYSTVAYVKKCDNSQNSATSLKNTKVIMVLGPHYCRLRLYFYFIRFFNLQILHTFCTFCHALQL